MTASDMGTVIRALLVASADGLGAAIGDFQQKNIAVTLQSFSLDVKFQWVTDFSASSTTKLSVNVYVLSASESLALKYEDKQSLTVEVKADLVPLAAPAAGK